MQMKSMETTQIENNKKQSHELPQTFADCIGKYVIIEIMNKQKKTPTTKRINSL